MRKLLSLFVAIFLSSLVTFGQISQGGSPLSFSKQNSAILQTNLPTFSMPFVDVNRLVAEDIVNDQDKSIPWRFGENIDVNIDIKSNGLKDILPNGDKIWRLRVFSAGALTMNFTFDKYIIPGNAKLHLYNEQKSRILGAFTGFNNQADQYFATTLIEGEAIIIEYFEPANVSFEGQVHLNRVTHGYRNVLDFTMKAAKAFGSSGSCEFNVKCPLAAGWDNEIRSVCMLVTNSSGFCTGSLVNDVANDGIPYVLTANHCSTSNNFSSWVFWFNWESPTCADPGNSPAYQSVSGCTLKARSPNSDFCLVQMSSAPPLNYNVYYSGWDKSGNATQSTYGIHHPAGDIKKFSHATSTDAAFYSNAECWNVFWTINGNGQPIEGVTEGGSSGSPIFDANHRVIGQLYGGPSSCTQTGAANVNDFYGRFSYSWDSCGTTSTVRLKDWLDPANQNPPFIIGYDPNTPAVTLDASPSNILEPLTSYCSVQSISPKVTIRNAGSANLTSLTVRYNIDGGTNVNFNWSGVLATNAIDTVVFPAINLTSGNHTFNVTTLNPNGSTDENPANDSISKAYSVALVSSIPVTEDFEIATFPTANWFIDNPDGATTWTRTTQPAGNGTSTASAYIDLMNYAAMGEFDGLATPKISLIGASSIQMTFKVAYRRYNAQYSDTMKILVSTDCGVTYNPTPVYIKGGTTLATGADMTATFFPTISSDWRLETVDLSSYTGSNVIIKFVAVNRNGNNLFIDDINIFSSTTPPVADFAQSDTASCSGVIDFTDLSTNIPVSWLWNFGDGSTSTVQNPSHTYTQSGYYTVTLVATNQYGSDTIIKNNIINISLPVAPTAVSASRCGTGSVTLSATGLGNLEWYDAATAGNLVGTGSSFNTPTISSTTTYYVEDHLISPLQYFGNIQSSTNGSNYNSTTNQAWLIFDALSDFNLVSVEVNASIAGNRKISLINNAGITIDSAIINIPAGISRITLNFNVSAGTGYRLAGPTLANLWRSNTGAPYPYTLAGVASITGAGTTGGTSTRYYFFFNWEVQQYGCVSARSSATATINTGVTAGTASASTTNVCSGSTGILTLTGSTGNIQWLQASGATGPWTNVTGGSGATTVQYITDVITAPTWFRAFTSSPGCTDDTSNIVFIDITASAVAGTAAANPSSVCSGSTASLTLTGYTGTIQWQVSSDGINWTDATTGTGFNTNNYTSDVIIAITYFRAKVSLAPCNDAFSNTVTVTITPGAVGGTATANNNIICTGSIVSFTLSGHTGTIRWQRSLDGITWTDESGILATFSTYVVNNLTVTTYFRAKLTQGTCPDAFSNSVLITVNPNPVAGTTTANPTNVCTGNISVISLSGSSGNINWQQSPNGTGSWTNVTTGSGDSTVSYTTGPLSVTTYYRAVLSTQGCISQNSTVSSVTVIPGPVGGVAAATSSNVCTGNSTIINLSGQTGTIQWEESTDGLTGWTSVTSGSGAASASYTTGNLTIVTYFRAKLSQGSCPDVYSNVVPVFVDELAVAGTATENPSSVCTGNTADLALSGYTGSIQWQESADGLTGWNDVTGAVTDLYTTSALINTSYFMAVVSSGNCPVVNSNVISVTVVSGPVGGNANAADLSVCSGSASSVTLTGFTGTIQWESSSDGISGWANVTGGSGATTATYSTGNLTAIIYYRARLAQGSCPDVYSNIVSIDVDVLPVGGTVSAPATIICSGTAAGLTLNGYTGNIQWQESSDGLNWTNAIGATSDTYTTGNLISLTYFRAELSSGACQNDYSNVISVNVTTNPAGGNATTSLNIICGGEAVDITLTGYTGSIQWQESADGLTGWTNITGAIAATYNTGSLSTTTYFRAVLHSGVCTDVYSNVVDITVNEIPVGGTASALNSTVCSGSTTVIDLVNFTGNIQWQESADGLNWSDVSTANSASFTTAAITSLTYFRAELTSGLCPVDYSNVVSINVVSNPVSGTASVVQNFICAGDVAELLLSGSAGTIQWQQSNNGTTGWTDISGAVTASYTTAALSATYYFRAVVGSGTCSSVNSNVVMITVNPALVATFTTTNATTGNSDGSATVNVTGGMGAYTYSWDNGQITQTAINLAAGSYTVTVSDGYCSEIATIIVNEQGLAPVASFNTNPVTICSGVTVNFNDNSTNNPTSWYWIFEGGTPANSNQQNPTVTYNAEGTYAVTLIVSNAEGSDTLFADNIITVSNPVLNVTVTNETTLGAADGTASVVVTGGTAPYFYSWSNGGNTDMISGLSAGSYSVVVLDANNCMATAPAVVGVGTSVNTIEPSVNYSIHPNPVVSLLIIELNGNADKIEISDILGRIIYSNVSVTKKQSIDMTNYQNGVYMVKIYSGNNVKSEKVIVQK